jgi:hypothetical protein
MSRLRRWGGRGALAAIAAIVVLVVPATSANAQFLGGAFPHTAGNWLNLGYTTQGSYIAQQQAAASSWHVTPTRLIVFQEPIANSEEDFYGFAYTGTWWGLATLHPCNTCTYTWADLQLNTNTLGSESNFIRQKVAAHEFGHGIGLAHVVGGTVNSIMRQGTLTYNLPQTHDINNTNTLYP